MTRMTPRWRHTLTQAFASASRIGSDASFILSWIHVAPAAHSRAAWTEWGIPIPSWVRHMTGSCLLGSSGMRRGLHFSRSIKDTGVGLDRVGLVPDGAHDRRAVESELMAAGEAVRRNSPDGENLRVPLGPAGREDCLQ